LRNSSGGRITIELPVRRCPHRDKDAEGKELGRICNELILAVVPDGQVNTIRNSNSLSLLMVKCPKGHSLAYFLDNMFNIRDVQETFADDVKEVRSSEKIKKWIEEL
jgi:hypothetical protein